MGSTGLPSIEPATADMHAETEWFHTAFGDLYPRLYAHRDEESATREIRDLVRLLDLHAPSVCILDLACGGGRHSWAFACLGFYATGLDLSPSLIAQAATHKELRGRLVQGDMRNLPYGPYFDLVVSLFTSLGYYQDDGENGQVFSEMMRVLVPGGRVVIDHINRIRLEQTLIPSDSHRGDGFTVHQHRRFVGQRVEKEVFIAWDAGTTTRWCESVRLYTVGELTRMLRDAGMGKLRFYGSMVGDPYEKSSERMIVVARKE